MSCRSPPTPPGMDPHRAIRRVEVRGPASVGTSPEPWPSGLCGHVPARPARRRLVSGFCPSARGFAPRFLPTVGRPSAAALRFDQDGLLSAGLAPARQRPCWAHMSKAQLAHVGRRRRRQSGGHGHGDGHGQAPTAHGRLTRCSASVLRMSLVSIAAGSRRRYGRQHGTVPTRIGRRRACGGRCGVVAGYVRPSLASMRPSTAPGRPLLEHVSNLTHFSTRSFFKGSSWTIT